MGNLTILTRAIRQLNGLYCLNDLHKAAGAETRHQPTRFVRLDQTQELIAEIQRSPDLVSAIETKTGGNGGGGTYACRELVYAYAMWISPKFHLHVIRAFDQMLLEDRQDHTADVGQMVPATEAAKYQMLNAFIGQLNLQGNPVLVPYFEITELARKLRGVQAVTDGLVRFSDEAGQMIDQMKTITGRGLQEE